MDGCSSLTDLNLESCNKLTADAMHGMAMLWYDEEDGEEDGGLAEFCAHPPPMLQKLNLSQTNLESKWQR